ncbi:MAG: phosphate ABC transporter substrate-binding protein [Ktedonobacteraceae bacterium]|nr:phosphate ABC transporter substrate-binding protein [Ktedonobacteraceae bacterium]
MVLTFLAFLVGAAGCTQSNGTLPDLSGHILVVGSTALQPLATAAASLFQQQHPQAHIEVRGGGSLSGLRSVTGHQADVGNSDIYADPALYPDPNLTDHIVAVVPFTMIVGPDVTVPSLTQQQIIDIFSTGKIRNWSQVGGSDVPIVPVVRPATSGTRATLRKYILGGRDEKGRLLQTDSSQTVRDTVAHTRGAISYLALSVLNSSVKAIAIGGKMATPQNIEAGSYAFWGYEHMYTLGNDNPLVAAFLDFMLTSQVQHLAQRLSYIPIADMKLPTARINEPAHPPLDRMPLTASKEMNCREEFL